MVWIRQELLPNQSWIIWRPTGMFDETEADWLHPFLCIARKTKQNSAPPPLRPSFTLKKIKQSSCGFGLAQHKDRQNKWTYVDLQKKKKKNVGKRVLKWIFTADVVLVRTDVGGLASCHACKTPASYQLTVTS